MAEKGAIKRPKKMEYPNEEDEEDNSSSSASEFELLREYLREHKLLSPGMSLQEMRDTVTVQQASLGIENSVLKKNKRSNENLLGEKFLKPPSTDLSPMSFTGIRPFPMDAPFPPKTVGRGWPNVKPGSSSLTSLTAAANSRPLDAPQQGDSDDSKAEPYSPENPGPSCKVEGVERAVVHAESHASDYDDFGDGNPKIAAPEIIPPPPQFEVAEDRPETIRQRLVRHRDRIFNWFRCRSWRGCRNCQCLRR